MLPVLYVIFVLSGAAGLMYESIWSRYLGLFVGHGAYAQILVLVIFLGGMSAGAAAAGRRSDRLRDPLRAYAWVELGVGIIGAVFHPVFVGATDWAYGALLPALPAGGVALVAKWLLAALLILPQSVLLGATFPLMSAGVLRRAPGAPGRVLALLYFANSLGAAGGVLVAGFWLLAAAGLPGTLAAAAAINTLVAGLAWLVARTDEVPERAGGTTGTGARVVAAGPAMDGTAADVAAHVADSALLATPRLTGVGPAPAPHQSSPTPTRPRRRAVTLPRLLLAVAFGTAVASFVYEVAWIRMLSLVAGSATHSFEIMLSAFILGLALGAWWIRTRADRLADPVRTLGIVQWVMGSLAIATLPVYLLSFRAMAWLLGALDTTPAGYQLFAVGRYLLSLAVMLPATFCAGCTLPLITRILLAREGGESAIGRVYAVNTLGSILGAALAGLVLMPVLGLKWLLVAGALVDIGLGIALLYWALHASRATTASPGRRAWGVERAAPGADDGALLSFVVVAVLVLLTGAASARFDPAVLTSGVYRYARVSDPARFEMRYYRDGRTATVSVRREIAGRTLSLATNGKPDASLSLDWMQPPRGDSARRPLESDQTTQALLPLVALAHAPRARTAAVIGEGSGMTSHLLLGSPYVQRVTTIDIEPEMIRGSHEFYPANRRVFDDPRSRFVVDDAKAFFASAGRTFDVIVSEPSNPWVSGVSGLFTDEFYARVQRYLAPGGVFGQWLHLYEIDDSLVLSVLAALHRHFPAYEIYLVSGADLFVVATNGPTLRRPDWRVVSYPAIAADLRRALPLDSASLDGARLADRAALAPLLDRWSPVNSDFHPVLDLGAERTRFLRTSASGFRNITNARFDPVAAWRGWRIGFGAAPRPPFDLPRTEALAHAAALRMSWTPQQRGAGELPFLTLDGAGTRWVRDALYRRAGYEDVLASGRAPVDWRRFVAHALDVADDVHGGTAGVVDSTFWPPLLDYLRRTQAPARAVAAVRFAHGLAAYDFAESAAAADTLVPALRRGEAWVRADHLMDGAVVSALKLGDVERARRWLDALAPIVDRADDDVRTALLRAWMREIRRARTDTARADTARNARPITRDR